MNVYPIFLNNLHEQRAVVIGGDHEAERKAKGLLDCDAAVTVISPTLTEPLQAWADEGRIDWRARTYRDGDLEGAFLVIVSETNPEATRPIWEEAQARNVLINAMDDVPHCTFVAGSVVQRGPLTIAISTSGCAPALSVRMRQWLEEKLGDEYADFLELMRDLREPMAEHYPAFEERRDRWYRLVDEGVLDLLRAGDREAAHRRIDEIVGFDAAAYRTA